jgi:hypothetical protein
MLLFHYEVEKYKAFIQLTIYILKYTDHIFIKFYLLFLIFITILYFVHMD